ncbi:DgyrCDS3501 [Dimorphilus gyrociliatus]|uniref:DgyrCDS3501 n=1 Tax=Dimorphilus gyrociliatus TaxID=2664684 RepID=A0A7I8VDY5_9ANNE|nr:DgyrCDS3501 [Dimorphilus gyrociliatus]
MSQSTEARIGNGKTDYASKDIWKKNHKKADVKYWPLIIHRTRREKTPLVFHEPYVTNGYRPINFPLKNYFLSIFQLHNESFNVWTHLAAFFAVIYKAYDLSKDIDMVNDPHAWPIVTGLFCAGFLYLSSTGAHLLHSMSELMHYTAFMVDYADGTTGTHYLE